MIRFVLCIDFRINALQTLFVSPYHTPFRIHISSTIEYDGSCPGDYDELVGTEHDHHHQIVDAKTEADALEGAYPPYSILFIAIFITTNYFVTAAGGIEMTSATSVDFQVIVMIRI